MILSKTPLRISFFGGGTDFPEFFRKHPGSGAVLGTAIDKYIYHSVIPFHSALFDYNIRIAYRQVECVSSPDEIKHRPFREVLKFMGIEKDIEIGLTADLPSLSGLGSSSSFVVGLLNALQAYRRTQAGRLELAYDAIRIEREILEETVGCQDQVFAAVGGLDLIEFMDVNNIVVHRLPIGFDRMRELDESLLLFFTGIRRRAEEVEKRKIQNLDIVNDHLVDMRRLVDEGYSILVGNQPLDKFGCLLDRTWELKKKLDTGVTNDSIDLMYRAGIEAGALGGKLLGAGGGGFMLFFVPAERQVSVRAALKDFYEIPFHINAGGSQIVHC